MPTFCQILNLSLTGSILLASVLIVRLLPVLRELPKAWRFLLWAMVAIRLLVPFSFESDFSMMPTTHVIPEQYLTMEPIESETPVVIEVVKNPNYAAEVTIDLPATADRLQIWDVFATVIWLGGICAMGIYAAISYLSMRLCLRMAAKIHGNVWECDDLATPFIMGLFRPRIYLPPGLDDLTTAHVLAHENAHIRRLDHLWKPLGFAIVSIHWFNPLVWIGYQALCRDIEMACDERVIRDMDKTGIRAYLESLLRCAAPGSRQFLCPLAFGEGDVTGRIRSMLRYRKPGILMVITGVAVSLLLTACFLTSPPESTAQPTEPRTNRVYTIDSQDGLLMPRFQLHADGTFFFTENPLSSYLGHGVYTIEDRILTLQTDDGHYIWKFREEDGDYLYLREGSSLVTYYLPDLRHTALLPDGARFVLTREEVFSAEDPIAELLDTICSSPLESSNPGAYIEAHREEYRTLVKMGEEAVLYCFGEFSKGSQTGLKGHIMAILCREIIGVTDDTGFMTGQDWFNDFSAEALLLRDKVSKEDFHVVYPWHSLALDSLGI